MSGRQPNRQIYFVTGTDTGVGKTKVSELLLRRAVVMGGNAFGLKPVTCGCAGDARGGRLSEDAQRLMACSNVQVNECLVAPIKLLEPQSPHIAAAAEHIKLTVDSIADSITQALAIKSSHVIIEGVGGWRVPLNNTSTMACVVAVIDIPVILVVGIRLGCINHALLTLEAIKRDGLNVAGWVANCVDNRVDNVNTQISSLQQLLAVPCLGVIPFLGDVLSADAALNTECIRWPNELA